MTAWKVYRGYILTTLGLALQFPPSRLHVPSLTQQPTKGEPQSSGVPEHLLDRILLHYLF